MQETSAGIMRRRYSVTVRALSLALLVSGILIGCASPPRRVAEDLALRATPPWSNPPAVQGPDWIGHSIRFTWHVDIPASRADYMEWLTSQLREFGATKVSQSHWSYSRYSGGDTHRLEVDLETTGTANTIRCVYISYPD